MTAHCQWCSDPWRAVILGLARRGLRVGVITRHYGLRRTTATEVIKRGRKQGCIPPATCRYCGVGVSAKQIVCRKQRCASSRDRDSSRLRRARFGPARKGPLRISAAYVEPPDFEWPELPENPRERNVRAPCPIVGPPIIHRASLVGAGAKSKPEQEAAIAAYWAGVKRNAFPVSPPTRKRITPFHPLATPEPRTFWEVLSSLRESGRKRPANSFIRAPPLCPTIGTVDCGRIAA